MQSLMQQLIKTVLYMCLATLVLVKVLEQAFQERE